MKKYLLSFLIISLSLMSIFNCTLPGDLADPENLPSTEDPSSPDETSSTLDSDGDGYSNEQEINDFLFSAEINPLKFNPYIADVPGISFNLTGLPKIIVNYTDEYSQARSIQTAWSTTEEESITTSNTLGAATSEAHSAGVTIGVSHEFGLDGGTSVSAEARYDYSYTSEVSSSFTGENNETRSSTYDEAQSVEHSETRTLIDGTIKSHLEIVNSGDIAYTLENITLEAIFYQPLSSNPITPIANLTYEGGFSPTTLAVNQSMSGVFSATISTSVALKLLSEAGNIRIRIASYEVVDENGRSFAHNDTAISAKTFRLMIDYGVGTSRSEPETYRISDADDNDTLDLVLTNILGIDDYTEGESDRNGTVVSGLTKVRNLDTDTSTGGWMIVHNYSNGGIYESRYYTPAESYSLSDISPVRGDTVILMYVEDKDHDGLLAREEFSYGTSDLSTDTDGDGVDDKTEIENGTNPVGEDIEYDPSNSETDRPVGVSYLTVNPQTSNRLNAVLSWNDPSTGYDNIYIARNETRQPQSDSFPKDNSLYSVGNYLDPNGETQIIAILSPGTTTYVDSSLKYSTDYWYFFFTKDNSTGLYSEYYSGDIVQLNTDRKIRFSVQSFSISDAEDGNDDSCEYSWQFNLYAGGTRIAIFDDKTQHDAQSISKGGSHSFDVSGMNVYTRVFEYYYSDDFYFDTSVEESDNDNFLVDGDDEIVFNHYRTVVTAERINSGESRTFTVTGSDEYEKNDTSVTYQVLFLTE